MFSPSAPDEQFVQNCAVARAQANFLLNLYGPTKQAAEKYRLGEETALSG
jgi:hypothetical protein